MIRKMTPTARKPGISRTVCSHPISTPVKPAASMTKLFRSADHVAKAMGIANAIRNSTKTGCLWNGNRRASANGMVFKLSPIIGIPIRLSPRFGEPHSVMGQINSAFRKSITARVLRGR